MIATIFAGISAIAQFLPKAAPFVGILKQVNWKVAAPTIIAVALLGFTYYKGYSEAQAHFEARQLEQQITELKAQLARLDAAKIDAEKKTIDIDAKNVELNHKVSEYVASIEKRGKQGVCRLTDADLRGLRNLSTNP